MNRCRHSSVLCFFFNDTATTEIYTLSLHDALPIFQPPGGDDRTGGAGRDAGLAAAAVGAGALIYGQGQVRQDLTEKEPRSEEHTSELQAPCKFVWRLLLEKKNTHRCLGSITDSPAH